MLKIPYICQNSSYIEIETEDINSLHVTTNFQNTLNANGLEKYYDSLCDEPRNDSIYQGKDVPELTQSLRYEFSEDKDEVVINEEDSKKDLKKSKNDCFPFTESLDNRQFIFWKKQKKKGLEKDKKHIARKDKTDDIKKKLKATFLKALKNIVNEKLKSANSKKLFDFFPQLFVKGITKKYDKYWNMEIIEIWNTDFSEGTDIEEKEKNINKDKYQNNHRVLDYLDKNPIISKESEFDDIKIMTCKQLYKAYIKSDEFWNVLKDMRKGRKPPSSEYINKFIYVANNFIKDLP